MPHITLECSSNVDIDFQSFFKDLSEALINTGHAAKLGIKCRVVTSEEYFIIDGSNHYKMINLLYRLREGRTKETLQSFSEIGIKLLEQYCEEDIKRKQIILSTEIKELVRGIDITKNAVR